MAAALYKEQKWPGEVQFAYSSLYQQIQVYLYGQAATMTDSHIAIYDVLALIIAAVVALIVMMFMSL